MSTKEKIMNGWQVKVYNPEQVELPKEEREVLLNKKFKNVRLAHAAILEVLEPHDITISYSSMRNIAHGSYSGKNSVTNRSIDIEKCKITVRTQIIEKEEIN